MLPAYAEEADPYPLKGTFSYTEVTRESIDKKLAEGWVFIGGPYGDVGTCLPFTNSVEWVRVNTFYGQEISYDKILITLAGLKPTLDPITGSELTDYENAAYTAEYIASRCVYMELEGKSIKHEYNI